MWALKEAGASDQLRGRTEPRDGVNLATPVAALESGIQSHMPHGAVLSIAWSATQQGASLAKYDLEADFANFTGHYLAAESFRYAAAPNPEALERVKRALAGLDRLFWVTDDAVLLNGRMSAVPATRGSAFARTALQTRDKVRYRKGELPQRGCTYVRPEAGWVITLAGGVTGKAYASFAEAVRARDALGQGSVGPNESGPVWHGWGCGLGRSNEPTSRDAYSGVLMGLAYAYQLVPDGSVKQEARRLFTEMLEFLLANDWNVVTQPENKVATEFLGHFHTQLALLRIAATMNPEKYAARYNELKPASIATWLPLWFSALDPISKYYKFNLESAVLGPLLLYETDPLVRKNYMDAYMVLRRATAHHRNGYFNLLRILVEPPATRAAVANGRSGSNPNLALKDEVKASLAEWIDRREVTKNFTGMPTSAVSDRAAQVQKALWPSLVKINYPLQDASEAGYQALYALPVSERVGNLDFVWQRSPFGTAFEPRGNCKPPLEVNKIKECSGRAWREGPGVDYLLPYWLGRYLSVVPPT